VTLTPSAVEIAGVFNFRDLGGGVTASGRRVRSGVIFRSAALDEMTDEGLATLESLGVRTVVDVRSESEVEIDGRFPFERSSIRWVHVPSPMGPPRPGSKEPDSSRSEMADHEDPMSLVFTRIMTVGAPFVGRVIREVADPTNKSVVLHCTSGKDRTGVIAALIQLIIGRDLDTVVADFERTRDYTDRIKADLRIRLARFGEEHMVERISGIDARWLLDALDLVGGPTGLDPWLDQIGVDAEIRESLRTQMLE
jgi:rhodanese-related sulfurtransferase